MLPAEVLPKGLVPGTPFGRYVIEGFLGAGGMARVYRARDTALGRVVALKVLHQPGDEPSDTPSMGGKERIQREARALASLEHPNVVAVYDVGEVSEGEHAGTAYLTMELVRGRSLRTILQADVPSLELRVRWLGDAARGLAAAHRAGVVHRDVKPDNILVRDDGVVKVLDFGIAKSTSPPSGTTGPVSSGASTLATITGVGVVVGTPYYMSPEQLRGERVDARTDQFSWGVVAYQLLTGAAPWGEGHDAVNLISRILGTTPPDVRSRNPAIPTWLAALVDRVLSKDPDARFPSMDDVVDALERGDAAYVPTESLAAASLPPPGTPSAIARWRRVSVVAAAIAFGAFVVVGLARWRTRSAAATPSSTTQAPEAPRPQSNATPAPAPLPPPVSTAASTAAPVTSAHPIASSRPSSPATHPPRSVAPAPVDPFGDRK
jgi:serine/threonine-protein kinase